MEEEVSYHTEAACQKDMAVPATDLHCLMAAVVATVIVVAVVEAAYNLPPVPERYLLPPSA